MQLKYRELSTTQYYFQNNIESSLSLNISKNYCPTVQHKVGKYETSLQFLTIRNKQTPPQKRTVYLYASP